MYQDKVSAKYNNMNENETNNLKKKTKAVRPNHPNGIVLICPFRMSDKTCHICKITKVFVIAYLIAH